MTPPSAPAPRRPSLAQLVDVETPEQVVFSYTIAGVGSRAAAAVIDYAICIALVAGVVIVMLLATNVTTQGRALDGAERAAAPWVMASLVVAQFAVLWGYYVIFETLWDGQTPGKRRIGIRVVQDGGYSISFGASAVRNLARIIDMQPGFLYAVGIVSAAVSRSGKRLGDVLAGTFVVQERVLQLAPVLPAPARVADGAPAPATSALLSDEEFQLLERFLARRSSIDADRRQELATQLAHRFATRLPADPGQPPLPMLLRLFAREQAACARGLASRGDTGAAREQHALVADGATRWSAFAAVLADAQRRGLRKMTELEVSAFVAQYREVATDLARLQTAARGREVDALFYVSRLVAAGHNLLYRQKPVPVGSVWRYMTESVPREIRRSWRPIALAATALFAPMLITYAAVVRDPRLATDLLPPTMIDRAEEGVTRAKLGKGYITIQDIQRPVMATSIIANNVQVTYAVFAFGITGGVLTMLMLVFNGISIGAATGLYASRGIARLILEFMMPHGVLELSAICIAGGGGLLIAAGMLLPGARTRGEAIVVQGRRAIRLVAGSTMLLIVAGTIEGLVSPRTDVPAEGKWLVSLVSGLLLLLYVTRGRGAAAPAMVEEENAYSAEPPTTRRAP